MNTSTKQRLLTAFSCVLVGCAVGATMPRLAAQSFQPNPTAPRWEQFCETLDTDASANRRIAARGAGGFELVSIAFAGHTNTADDLWVCFKRPVAR